jgi:hydrogenase/urease accessory protein HupE
VSVAALSFGLSFAHLVTTGFGPFYDGLLHVLETPQDLLPVVALALFAGLRGAKQGRLVLFLLPAAWLAGGLAGLLLPMRVGPVAATASLLLCGLLVATDARLPSAATAALAVLVGLAHGIENGGAMARMTVGIPGLIGIVATTFVVSALAAALVVSLRVSWARIAVRVAGSWIAATGLLLVGWSLRPPR